MFMQELKSPGTSVLVERLEEGREGEWARVGLNETGLYNFESSQHVHYVSSLKTIHEFLTRWAFEVHGRLDDE
jgi:hypothetical protein